MLTQEILKKYLNYDHETGIFTRLLVTTNAVKIGDIAGSINPNGYIYISLLGRKYTAHRLAFLYMLGAFPQAHTDHKNGNRIDNRWENLREASTKENAMNKSTRADNTSGFIGVSYSNNAKKWMATCKGKHLGYFDNPTIAAMAYQHAAKEMFGEFYRGNN